MMVMVMTPGCQLWIDVGAVDVGIRDGVGLGDEGGHGLVGPSLVLPSGQGGGVRRSCGTAAVEGEPWHLAAASRVYSLCCCCCCCCGGECNGRITAPSLARAAARGHALHRLDVEGGSVSAAGGPGQLPAQHRGADGRGGEGRRVAGVCRVRRGAVRACLAGESIVLAVEVLLLLLLLALGAAVRV